MKNSDKNSKSTYSVKNRTRPKIKILEARWLNFNQTVSAEEGEDGDEEGKNDEQQVGDEELAEI